MTDLDPMEKVLLENGLVRVYAMEAGSYKDEGFDMTVLAFYDPKTKMFFSKGGLPTGANPEESARSVMPAVEIHPNLCASPFDVEAPPAKHLTDLMTTADHGSFDTKYRVWDPLGVDAAAAAKVPELVVQYVAPWCAIVAQEMPRYQHRHGMAVRWAVESPTIMTRHYLFDTHSRTVVEPDPTVEGDVTYLGGAAPRNLFKGEYRGKTGLSALRLFYAGLPR